MFFTIPCQVCSTPVMQRDVEAQLVKTLGGIFLLITAYCKLCDQSFVYKIKAE